MWGAWRRWLDSVLWSWLCVICQQTQWSAASVFDRTNGNCLMPFLWHISAWKAVTSVEEGGGVEWFPGVSTSARVAFSGNGILIEGKISTMHVCLWSPGEYAMTVRPVPKRKGDKGRNHWVPQALRSVSAPFWNAESHVCEHLFLICSIPLTPCLTLSPFSVLPAFLCVRGQPSGRGWARTGSRDRPGNASVRSDVTCRLRAKGKTSGRRWVWGGCWLPSYVTPALSHNINPFNTLKRLPALIKLKRLPTTADQKIIDFDVSLFQHKKKTVSEETCCLLEFSLWIKKCFRAKMTWNNLQLEANYFNNHTESFCSSAGRGKANGSHHQRLCSTIVMGILMS